MQQPTGIGIHCFAGGFTMGMKTVLPVAGQLEIHNFGRQTAAAHGTKFMNADTWEAWDDYRSSWRDCNFCFGNPRCTSFSCYSSGRDVSVRGPRAKPTRDIWDLCRFGVKANLELIAFESVQQCYTVGRQLLNMIREELFEPNGYRIAHIFVNTAAERCAQKRQRYFFVAYKAHRNFNVYLPELDNYCVTSGDVLEPLMKRKTHEYKLYGQSNINYSRDSYVNLTPDEKAIVPYLKDGWDINYLGRIAPDVIKASSKKFYKVLCRSSSGIPFSLHCATRIKWSGHCPTISSTSGRLIHPKIDRPLTVGEIAAMMNWPKDFIPVGPDPIGQIGKGVVPPTAAWLGHQIKLYFEDFWKHEDFESSYDKSTNAWVGHNFTQNQPMEKIFNLTQYIPTLKRI